MAHKLLLIAGIFVVVCLFLCEAQAHGQEPNICDPTKAVAVCYPAEPITFERCGIKVLKLHFTVQNSGSEPYKFSYQLFKDGKPVTDPITSGDGFNFTGSEIEGLVGSLLTQKFGGSGTYHFTVTLQYQHPGIPSATFDSTPQTITFTPKIRAVIIGISSYKLGGPGSLSQIPNLSYADDDAMAFDGLVTQLFPVPANEVGIVLLTSQDRPTKKAILDAITNAKSRDFCADEDWFIFYFSGHGVVENDEDGIRHYISTWGLDAKDVDGTAVWISTLDTSVELIRAHNKIVVFDSCFSGTNLAPRDDGGLSAAADDATPSKGVGHRVGKITYVERKEFVKGGFRVADQIDSPLDTSLAKEQFTKLEKSAIYLAASSANHVAEEGVLTWDGTKDKLVAHDDGLSPPKQGDGFLTYTFLSELESQIPLRLQYKEVLPSMGKQHIDTPSCKLDFAAAGRLAAGDLGSLGLVRDDTQVPEPGQTPDEPPKIPCDFLPARK